MHATTTGCCTDAPDYWPPLRLFECHVDTWVFIAHAARDSPNFRAGLHGPAEGFISVSVSGPSLAAVLGALWYLKDNRHVSAVERAIAKRLYELAGETVDTIDPKAPKGTPVPPIVIDDSQGENPTA